MNTSGLRGLRWPSLLLLAGTLLAGCNQPATDTATNTNAGDAGGNAAPGTNGPAPAGGEGGRIVFITNGTSPFWLTVEKGLQDANEKFPIKATMLRNDGTSAGQIQKLEQVSAQSDVKGVAISLIASDAKGITDRLKALQAKGVHVVTVDSDGPADSRYAFIGANNVAAGELAGKAAAQLLPAGGKVVAFVGTQSAANARERLDGFKKGAGAKFQVVDVMEDNTDPNKARQNVTAALQSQADAKVMLGLWSYNAPAIAEEVTRANKRAQLKLVTFDAEPNTITQLQKGVIDATIIQQPYQYGYLSVELLNALISKDHAKVDQMVPASKLVDVPCRTVISNPNGAIKPGPDVISVDELKKYMDEKGLKST